MEIKNLKREERKNVGIYVKTYKSYSEFMKAQNLSPTKVFNETVRELMDKQVAEEIAEKAKPKKKTKSRSTKK